MSYVSQGEKIFAYQNPNFPDCTPPAKTKRSDHRLKRFHSTFDRRAWHVCDVIRYEYLYDLISGSQTCLIGDACHQYVPLEDLIRILMAEKDEYIKELERQLRECCKDQLSKAASDNKLSTDETEEVNEELSLLTQELNNSRAMLREAMHKLQNIDEIVNENKQLYCKLRCSEERIKYLEEKKKNLENELADLRSKSQIQMDLDKAQEMLTQVSQQREGSVEMDEADLQELALERDNLQEKVNKLEEELEEYKKKDKEIEMLRKQSQTDSLNMEEISKENECYKKKLQSMKCLEKQIQELKKQGRALADKYKREAQKAAEQMNKMCQATKELQKLREEKDKLRKRVDELASFESQYNALQRKLKCVDAVIAENEVLNSKLASLDKLEKENEYLRCKLEQVQEMEVNAAEDKERLMQLQCAIADQEEEMKELLCQIERLTSRGPEEELERLKCELYEKNSKLKLCEEQLAEIPMLEAEIDDLRRKLQCCCEQFAEKKTVENSYQTIEVRFPSTTTGISASYKDEKQQSSSTFAMKSEEDVQEQSSVAKEILQKEEAAEIQSIQTTEPTPDPSEKKEILSCEEVQNLLQSSKGIISCVLEDMIEHQKEMEELELCNQTMKREIEMLKVKVGNSDKDQLVQQIDCLKRTIGEKELEICKLKLNIPRSSTEDDEMDAQTLKDLNKQMKTELEAACTGLKQIAELEKLLELEHKARCKAEKALMQARGTVEPDDADFDCCKPLQKEIQDLKLQICELRKLADELKKENELLRELQQPCPDFSKELDEKCALENLLSLLQAELDAFKGQKLTDECEALRNELKRVMEQNCQLKALVDCYRQRLDLEKKSFDLAQAEGSKISAEKKVKSEEGELQQETELDIKQERLSEEVAAAKQRVSSAKEGEADLKKVEEAMKEKEAAAKRQDSAAKEKEAAVKQEESSAKEGEADLKKVEETMKEKEAAAKRQDSAAKEKEAAAKQQESLEKEKETAAKRQDSAAKEKEAAVKQQEASEKEKETAAKRQDSAAKEKEAAVKQQEALAKEKEAAVKQQEASAKEKEAAVKQQEASAKEKEAAVKQQEASAKEKEAAVKRQESSEKEREAESKKLEQMTKEREAESKKLDQMTKERDDLLKQLEQLKKEKMEGTKQQTPVGSDEECQKKLKQLEAENAEKMKKLMDQHEKELSNRDKAHNDNLNAMKAGYEADIKKLAERHKGSIIRLQGLHEDEVQELNTNYETQMETMQTQSEAAMRDVARGSAAKIRKLNQEHDKEMKTKEEKIQGLENSLSKSKEEAERNRKKAKDDVEGSVSQLKMKHSREIQKMRKGSAKRLSLMKDKYEGLLSEEKKKSEAQMETLKKKLKEEQEKGSGVCDCKFAKKTPRKIRDPTCPLDFNEVLEKILEQGLESLTFNEIALVHRKTCCALKGIVMNSDVIPVLEPPIGDGCPHTPLLQADKEQLLNRIFALENEIVLKQKQTQEAIINTEVAVKKERCRLQELKNILQEEQLKNSELKQLLTSQSKFQIDLKKERDKLGTQASLHQSLCLEKTKQLDQEKKDRKYLEEELDKMKANMKQLCMALDIERENSKCMQRKESDHVQAMRMKMEQSMNQVHRLGLQLENEAKYRMQLQCQLQALKQSFKQMVNLPVVEKNIRNSQNPLEVKTAKEKQNLDQLRERKNKVKSKSGKKQKK